LNINVFDILIVALPVAFLLLGFLHTGWREFLSLVGVAIGAALGAIFGSRLADIIDRVLPEKDLSAVIAFLLILAGGWALGGLLGGMAERMQSGSRSDSNRILPAIFGALKGGVLDLGLVWLVDRHIAAFQTPLRNASLTGYAQEVLSWLARHNPL
jgi:uncharacterized membrane protein required for colicin V production